MDFMNVDDPLYARLFARAPIYDLVFSYLSPRSLVRFALTCRAVYLAVAGFKRRAFNINRHFSRYFNAPVAFRSLQAKTNTLVSGSNALQFFDRTFYLNADLDIYTHPGHSFEVAQFLVEVEGYRFVPREEQEQDWKVAIGSNWDGTVSRVAVTNAGDRYPLAGMNAVWAFIKTGIDQHPLKVQVIEAASSPLEIILEFHSSMSSSVSMLSRVLSFCVILSVCHELHYVRRCVFSLSHRDFRRAELSRNAVRARFPDSHPKIRSAWLANILLAHPLPSGASNEATFLSGPSAMGQR